MKRKENLKKKRPNKCCFHFFCQDQLQNQQPAEQDPPYQINCEASIISNFNPSRTLKSKRKKTLVCYQKNHIN